MHLRQTKPYRVYPEILHELTKRGAMVVLCGTTRCSQSTVMLSQRFSLLPIRTLSSQQPNVPQWQAIAATSADTVQPWTGILKTLYRNSAQRVSATAKNWWDKYEEFVGLVEVREAQGNVAEAEKAFMVARAVVRDVREEVEAQQIKLKEVRDRLDRVSREDLHYLELATQEHKLLQEEKRIRASYVHAEDTEREKFSLFSAAVRESHEKERTRAERTKNWSVIGSIMGAIIGVMGSTYINRVRLQELRSLLLEAQKGPISLQEALREQAATYQLQQKDLSNAIVSLKHLMLVGGRTSQPGKEEIPLTEDPLLVELNKQTNYSKQMYVSLENLQKQFDTIGKSMSTVSTAVHKVKAVLESKPLERHTAIAHLDEDAQPFTAKDVIVELADAKQSLEMQINRNSCYTTALTCAVFAFTAHALYVLLKGQ